MRSSIRLLTNQPLTNMDNTTNHATDATTKVGNEYVLIESDGTPLKTRIVASNGKSLGLVQRVNWSMGLGGYARLEVETIASPSELKALMKDTTVLVRPSPSYHPVRYLFDYYATRVNQAFGHVIQALS